MSEVEEETAEGELPAEEAQPKPRRLIPILAAAGLLLVAVIVVAVALVVLRKPKAAEAGHKEAAAEFALPHESADQNAARAAALAKAAAEGDLKATPGAPPAPVEAAAKH